MSCENDEPMSTGKWFLTLLILAIPIVNVVMYVVWAVGVGNINRVNFCRASLLLALIAFLIAMALSLAGFALGPFLQRQM